MSANKRGVDPDEWQHLPIQPAAVAAAAGAPRSTRLHPRDRRDLGDVSGGSRLAGWPFSDGSSGGLS